MSTDTMSTEGAIFCFPELEKPTSKSCRVVGDSAASPRHHRAETPAKLLITTEPSGFAFSVRKHENPQTNKETCNPNSLNPNPNSSNTLQERENALRPTLDKGPM